jgi:hypothetical protein
MLTGALRPTDARFSAFITIICLLVGFTTAQAASPTKKKKSAKPAAAAAAETAVQPTAAPEKAAAPVMIKEWGPYLDVAYELSYWDRPEIKEWREKREQEIGEPLTTYIATWSGKLAGSLENAGTVREDNRQPIYREKDYLRLAIAQTVDYLQNENQESLNGAAQLLDKLKGKTAMPEIAFWTGFVNALQAIENNDSRQFVSQVYYIWNNAVLYIEQEALATATANSTDVRIAPFHYRNIVNLVVNRAIIERKLEDLNALGPLFLMLKERDLEEKEGESQYLTTLVKRISEGFVAPDSDRYRLNFTVAAIEAKRLQQMAYAKLDAEGMTEEARRVFEQSRLFDDLALKWAASPRSSGAVMAMVDYLDTTSFAIQRLPDNEKAPAYAFFAMLPTHDGSSTLMKAMAVYNDIATYTDGGWAKAGYANRDLYLKSVHRLWRATMELTLWTGDFYLIKLNAASDAKSILGLVTPMQVVLNSYLEFLATQKSRGFADVIPDFAYFGAAEAAEKLAHAYLKSYAYSTDITVYNLWFLRRLQASELFPFDPREIAQTAAILKRDGRYNLYLDYFLPLTERFRQSAAVKNWLEDQKSDAAPLIRDYVNSITEIFSAPLNPDGTVKSEVTGKEGTTFSASFRKLREDLQRKPDHPVHKLLKSFYEEEMQKTTPYTLLQKDVSRLNL